MKSHKSLVTLATVGLAGAAFSQYTSPEMMLVTDAGGTLAGGGTVQAQVERYDPYTGAYLGAFGAGYFTGGIPDGIAVVGQNAFVTELFSNGSVEYSRIEEFNFSTGAYQGTVFNSGPFQLTSVNSYGGNLIACDFGNSAASGTTGIIWTLSPTGATVGETVLPANIVTRDATVVGNQLWVSTLNATTGEGGKVYIYNLNSNGTVTGSPTMIGSPGGAYNGIVSTTVNGSQYVYVGGYNAAFTNGLIDKYTTAGAFNSEQTFSTPNGAYSLAAGHNGIIYAFDGSDTITRYDGGTSFGFGALGSFTLSETALGQNIAVYAAPEPVSMTLLGLGAIGLMTRRRRKA